MITTAQSAPTPHKHSPLEFFELQARAIWNSPLAADDKAAKLRAVSDSIHKYLARAEMELSGKLNKQDEWTRFSCARAAGYLEQLALHLRRLAVNCQQSAAR